MAGPEDADLLDFAISLRSAWLNNDGFAGGGSVPQPIANTKAAKQLIDIQHLKEIILIYSTQPTHAA